MLLVKHSNLMVINRDVYWVMSTHEPELISFYPTQHIYFFFFQWFQTYIKYVQCNGLSCKAHRIIFFFKKKMLMGCQYYRDSSLEIFYLTFTFDFKPFKDCFCFDAVVKKNIIMKILIAKSIIMSIHMLFVMKSTSTGSYSLLCF